MLSRLEKKFLQSLTKKIGKQYMSKKLKLEKYTSNRDQFVSVLREIPIRHLDCVRETVKRAASEVESATGSTLQVRCVFRGPRYWNPLSTHKCDARAFDVYVNTRNFPRRLTARQRQELAEQNRQEVIDTLRYSSDSLGC